MISKWKVDKMEKYTRFSDCGDGTILATVFKDYHFCRPNKRWVLLVEGEPGSYGKSTLFRSPEDAMIDFEFDLLGIV